MFQRKKAELHSSAIFGGGGGGGGRLGLYYTRCLQVYGPINGGRA